MFELQEMEPNSTIYNLSILTPNDQKIIDNRVEVNFSKTVRASTTKKCKVVQIR